MPEKILFPLSIRQHLMGKHYNYSNCKKIFVTAFTRTKGTSIKVSRSVSKDNMAVLHDIEESPTPSSASHEISTSSTPTNGSSNRSKISNKSMIKKHPPLQPPKIQIPDEAELTGSSSADTIERSSLPGLANKREPPKTPKSYFIQSLQQRRSNKAAFLTKSQSAAKFMLTGGTSLIRRGAAGSSGDLNLEHELVDEQEFTDIQLVHRVESKANQNRRIQDSKVASKYQVENEPKILPDWSYNFQQKWTGRLAPEKKDSCD